MKKNLRRLLCVVLCVLIALCVTPAVFGSFNDDPEAYSKYSAGRRASGPSTDDVTTYTHDARFATGYDIIDVIDVSYHNGIINWSQVYASGIHEVMIRVGYRGYSEGLVQADPEFVTNVKGAYNAGLKVGLYFFSQAVSSTEATQEASYVIEQVLMNDLSYCISLPVAIDFEYAENSMGPTGRLYLATLSKSEGTAICNSFCSKIAAQGFTPMIYTNKDMLSKRVYPNMLGYDIWLATWASAANYDGKYVMWQYTNEGRVNGITGTVDKSFRYVPNGTNNPSTPDPGTDPGNDNPPVNPPQDNSVTISDKSGVIYVTAPNTVLGVGNSSQYTATVNGSTINRLHAANSYGTPVWSSSNSGVATIDQNGLVKAVSAGNVSISATVYVTDKTVSPAVTIAYTASIPLTVSTTSSSGSSSGAGTGTGSGAGTGTGTGTGAGTGSGTGSGSGSSTGSGTGTDTGTGSIIDAGSITGALDSLDLDKVISICTKIMAWMVAAVVYLFKIISAIRG